MIVIVNVDSNIRKEGEHRYELKLNNRVVCQFTHNREDDLAACLRKAADAAEQAQAEKLARLLECFEL